ncbi:MAG: hypothetical protein CMI55_04680 [Parcubacteria group bacterium]|jgi:hypothetical protein|nr:hypothetical protein [Parcubacteria group bacterium]
MISYLVVYQNNKILSSLKQHQKPMSLNSVLQKRKRRNQREDGNLHNSILQGLIADTVSELVDKKFEEYFGKLKDKLENEVRNKTDLVLNNVKKGKDGEDGKSIKGDKGDQGDKGDSPTKKSLINLIKPLIPKSIIGKDGESIKGEKGDRGDAGSPDKPKDVVKKLNTLDNVLDVKVLKGLKPILKSIQDSIGSVKKEEAVWACQSIKVLLVMEQQLNLL